MNKTDKSLASRAAEYIAARDAARVEDQRRRQRENEACPNGDDFTFEGKRFNSIAQLNDMRPSKPMTAEYLQETIQLLQSGNALNESRYPAKLAAFEAALESARTHFAARDEARRAAGITDAADDDDARWDKIEELEINAWSTTVETLDDVAGFLSLLRDYITEMGSFDDHILESRLMARLDEAIPLLSVRKQ
jgi:hypothetical protein